MSETAQQTQENPTVTVDGEVHDLYTLPEGIQNAIGLYNTFKGQLETANVEVMKLQFAMQTLASQISDAVRAHAHPEPEVTDVEAK